MKTFSLWQTLKVLCYDLQNERKREKKEALKALRKNNKKQDCKGVEKHLVSVHNRGQGGFLITLYSL